jgi:Meiotically up-regulated gene 113
VIYFMQADIGGPIKIGYSATPDGVEKRRSTIQTGFPHKLIVLKTIEGGREKEKDLHARYGDLRLSGEWFEASPELARRCGGIATPVVQSLLDFAELRREIIDREFAMLRAQQDAEWEEEVREQAERMAGEIKAANERMLKTRTVHARILRDVVMKFVPRSTRPEVSRYVSDRLGGAGLPLPKWLQHYTAWTESDDVTEAEHQERVLKSIQRAFEDHEKEKRRNGLKVVR